MKTAQFETGASNARVNDLILWIENDRESWGKVELAYQLNQRHQLIGGLHSYHFHAEITEGVERYRKQFPNSETIKGLTNEDRQELREYFINWYSDWSKENHYLPRVKVCFADSSNDYWTSVSRNSTEETVKRYFVGVTFEGLGKVERIEFNPATY